MKQNKTQPTDQSAEQYIATIKDAKKQQDALTILEIMKSATGTAPTMWGPSIVGFGSYHYVYESGREGDSPLVAFSARSAAFVVYGLVTPENSNSMTKLGKYTQGKGCTYIKKLEDVDVSILKSMITTAFSTKQS